MYIYIYKQIDRYVIYIYIYVYREYYGFRIMVT